MAILSVLSNCCRIAVRKQFFSKEKNALVQALRKMSGGQDDRVMDITPSRYQYTRFKDDLHWYISLGVIPLGLLILYTNIFIGKATLAEIPEGYHPRHWEYFSHPITRFFVKTFHDDPQINYERTMHVMYEEGAKKEWSEKITKANKLMSERDDYRAWYYIPSDQGRHFRKARQEIDTLLEKKGFQ